ncbi:ribbon-helix-helix protein, CopG family [Paraburkholderia haematera]|uniref:Ribbon-helix-helix protein CopG domain-containing protein n=1 Tax=Paraburkholderia haematera TaxID=2793077 RepID=A0ABM8QSW5_9BURK|nr:ribbon-helix-helix protein, CopG family [Paraburkholderia haematera]CAE6713655.1 hypothetical protein R69888_01268 [Paraburkholderia haematera]
MQQPQRLNLILPKPILEPLKALSERDGRGVPELVRAAIIEFLAKNKQQ